MSLRYHDLLMQGVEFQPVQIDLSSKPAYFSTISTSGLVPAVAYKGAVVTESLDICRWVDETFDGLELVPADKKSRDAMEALILAASRINAAGLNLLAGRGSRCAGMQDAMCCARMIALWAGSFAVLNLQQCRACTEPVQSQSCRKVGLLIAMELQVLGDWLWTERWPEARS